MQLSCALSEPSRICSHSENCFFFFLFGISANRTEYTEITEKKQLNISKLMYPTYSYLVNTCVGFSIPTAMQ